MNIEKIKKKVIGDILKIEKGYVNHKSDSGGETNWGITKRVARKWGYQGSMKKLPKELAFKIYSKKYWDDICLTDIFKLSFTIGKEVADTGVNCGPPRAAEFLQRCLNALNLKQNLYDDLKVDMEIGNKTLTALEDYLDYRGDEGVDVLNKMLNSLQGSFYIKLSEKREKDEDFVYGWFKHRVS